MLIPTVNNQQQLMPTAVLAQDGLVKDASATVHNVTIKISSI